MKKLIMVLCLFFLSGCGNQHLKARDSFLFIKTTEYYGACTGNSCQPLRTIRGSGSSVLVHNTEKKSYVLTAAHLCTMMYDQGGFPKMMIDMLLAQKKGKKLSKSQELVAVDLKGLSYKAKVIAQEKNTDLCLLEVDRLKREPVKVAKHRPKIAEKVFNVAAPAGVFGKNMVPLFYGYYAGRSLNPFDENTASNIYTIPLTGGSSGSPVLNMKGELIGLIHSKLRRFDNIAFAVTLPQIQLFLHKNLMVKNYHSRNAIPTFKLED